MKFAKKVQDLGADAIIAVNNKAGGHRGPTSAETLLLEIKKECSIPVISAGGVGNKINFDQMINMGYSGVSIGSPFIASTESDVSIEYKRACVYYGKSDIVMTSKISGTPCTVINTPYVQQLDPKLNRFESYLLRTKLLKKWVKMFRFILGTIMVSKAAKKATYKTVWVAGPSIENTKKIESIEQIIKRFI